MFGNRVILFLNGGETDGTPITWTEQDITTTAFSATSVHAVDIDADGDVDVLVTSQDDDTVAVFLNGGEADGTPITWTEQKISTAADSAVAVYAADIDNDGDLDVLVASAGDDTVSVYLNGGEAEGMPITWTEQEITTAAGGARSVYAADFDRDGDVDVLAASFSDDTVAVFLNGGETDGAPITWTEQEITTTMDGPASVFAADVDGDGDMDVLAAARNDDTDDIVSVYINLLLPPPSSTPSVTPAPMPTPSASSSPSPSPTPSPTPADAMTTPSSPSAPLAPCADPTVVYLRDDAESGTVFSASYDHDQYIGRPVQALAFGEFLRGKGATMILSFDVPAGSWSSAALRLNERPTARNSGNNPYNWCRDSPCLRVDASMPSGFRAAPSKNAQLDARDGGTTDGQIGATTRDADNAWSLPLDSQYLNAGARTQLRMKFVGNNAAEERDVAFDRMAFDRTGATGARLELCPAA